MIAATSNISYMGVGAPCCTQIHCSLCLTGNTGRGLAGGGSNQRYRTVTDFINSIAEEIDKVKKQAGS